GEGEQLPKSRPPAQRRNDEGDGDDQKNDVRDALERQPAPEAEMTLCSLVPKYARVVGGRPPESRSRADREQRRGEYREGKERLRPSTLGNEVDAGNREPDKRGPMQVGPDSEQRDEEPDPL